MTSVVVLKRAGLIGLLVCLEGVVFAFLASLARGYFIYSGLEVLVLWGVAVRVVVVSVVLGGYVVRVRRFGGARVVVSAVRGW